MPKRFKLGRHRKNEHKTKGNQPTCTLTVEHVVLPQDSVTVACCTNVPTPPTPAPEPPESLVVSLALDVVVEGSAPTLAVLRMRMQALSVLPQGTVFLISIIVPSMFFLHKDGLM